MAAEDVQTGRQGGRVGKTATRASHLHSAVGYLPLFLGLVGLALYLFRLDAQSLWYDEAVSARLASMSLPDLVRWTANDIQPPLYYILLHLWTRAAGTTEWALRYFSAWWGVLIVCLGYALARRMTRSQTVGMLAASLFLFAPWNLYYSQEARMYTMLVALAMGVALVYLAVSDARVKGLVAGGLGLALLYTHYFGLFLLVAFSFWALLLWFGSIETRRLFRVPWRAGGRSYVHPPLSTNSARDAVLALVLSWAIVFVGYLPWLPFLVRRFRVDASYWQGTLKVGEALRHWWVHMTLGAPETFLEKDAIRWLPFFIVVTIVAIVLLVLSFRPFSRPMSPIRVAHRSSAHHFALVLLWLLVPPALILVLAYRSPKFNPRYLMLAYPAWIFLLVGAGGQDRGARAWRIAPSSISRLLPLLVLPFFVRADLAWFTDPAFTKPDFRRAIAYIRQHRTADEPVLLVSGHMSPVFDYYAPDIPRVRLPDIDVLDVNQVLGFEVAEDINRAISGASGVWLLLWQDEVVDPMGVVPFLLAQAGKEDTGVPNAFWHVRVRHFRLRPYAHVPQSPPIQHPVVASWANTVELLGYSQYGNSVALFFRPLREVKEDLRLHMEVWDDAGFMWGQADARPGPYLYPAFRWRPGKVVLGQHALPVVPGTPAGTYTMRVRLYSQAHPSGLDILDAAGNPAGKDVLLPGVVLSGTVPLRVLPPGLELEFPPLPSNRSVSQVITYTVSTSGSSDGPRLEAARLWPVPPWEPGQQVGVQLRWASSRPPTPGDTYAVVLVDGRKEWRLNGGRLAEIPTPAEEWPLEGRFFSQARFRIPREVEPGTWTLAVQVKPAETDIVVVQEVTQVEVEPTRRVFQLPATVAYPVDAVFGAAIRLVGVDVDPDDLRPGSTVPITVTWQSVKEVDRSYTAFVHVLGPDNRVIAQEDHIPCRGACPTDDWIAGEVVQDRYDLKLPGSLPASGLTLEVGLYDAGRPGYPRLVVTSGAETGVDAVRIPVSSPQ